MRWQRGVSSEPGRGYTGVCQETSDSVVGGLIGELEEVCVLVEHLFVTFGIPIAITTAHGQVGKEFGTIMHVVVAKKQGGGLRMVQFEVDDLLKNGYGLLVVDVLMGVWIEIVA